jgi:TATA-box binding protein (TBP) (component of TFIID and TFIIIB)
MSCDTAANVDIKFTNFVFRAQLNKAVDLQQIADRAAKSLKIHDAVLRDTKPVMLTLRRYLNNIIIFPSGKLRLMGCQITKELKATKFLHRIVAKKLCKSMVMVSPVKLQTITATCDFHQTIKLQHLHNIIKYQHPNPNNVKMNRLELEIFPALQVKLWSPTLHVNIFASGKVVMTGLKNKEMAETVVSDLTYFINMHKQSD